MSRIALFLGLATSTAAAHAQREASDPPCTRRAPRDAFPFTVDLAPALLGTFRLTLIQTNWGPDRSPWGGRLTLQLHDSVRRYRYVTPQVGRIRGERILWGWIDSLEADSAWATQAASRDPDSPGVEWIHGGLVFGWPDAFDGVITGLSIQRFSPHGFWGKWQSGGGVELVVDSHGRRLPDPEGYFCAVRLPYP